MQTSEAPQDTAPVAGATLVAEAATAEAALEEVHATYGPGARIIAAKRVLRGGIGGFFAREVVQIHAAAGTTTSGAAPGPAPDAPTTAPAVAGDAPATAATASPIDRLLADAGEEPDEVDFATFLRRQLAPQPAAAQSASVNVPKAPGPGHRPPATPVTWPSADSPGRPAWADAPAGSTVTPGTEQTPPAAETEPLAVADTGLPPTAEPLGDTVPEPTGHTAAPADEGHAEAVAGRAWSRTTLIRLGLPVDFVQSLTVSDAADDVAWTFALAEALRPLCRPLPAGRSLLIGPRARGLAAAIGMPVTAIGQPLLALGDVAAGVTGSETSLHWLARARRGRWLHLVAGGKGWRELLHADPLAISWAAEEHLPEALRAAVELGLVLGYGPAGGTTGRAQPLDVALAIRDLVPSR
ncbi:hypothetical protein [Egicoccus sp. AB-alg6-2]|uniref:hypothetical protein n=1 Tax=Egicoccus sp. AB-alg6-2 TaxID=3242692 RepID=UPI00359E92E8